MRSIRVVTYEHEQLVVGCPVNLQGGGQTEFTEAHFEVLARYCGRQEAPPFRLGHRTIIIGHHVGYLRVGPVTLQIYPKLRRQQDADWRGLLLEMLRVIKGVRLRAQELAGLDARNGDLYEVLVRRFVDATQALLREGLARSYREIEDNGNAFRGRLLVTQHLRHNHVRQERLYVAYEVHDADNLHNRILRRALERVKRTTTSATLRLDAEATATAFPDEVAETAILPGEWSTALNLDRRTERYREALELARMILSDERPDLRWGERETVALLFDMNALFERYVEEALRGLPGVRVASQVRRTFWTPSAGQGHVARPDILLFANGETTPVIIDAKWKSPEGGRMSDADLRQLFAYLHAFGGTRGALVFPRAHPDQRDDRGLFLGGPLEGRVLFVDLFSQDKPDLRALGDSLATALLTEAEDKVGKNTKSVSIQ